MNKTTTTLLILGFLVGALGYWTIDFSEEGALYHTFFYIKAPGAFLVSLIAGFIRKKQPTTNSLLITAGVLAGMLSRIFIDMIQDPTSHNLFPFELMIGLVIVMPVAFLGSYLVHGIFYLAGKN